MKTKSIQILSILLAGLLQVAPLLRSFLPNVTGLAPNAWGFILKLGVGATALIGFDSVSKASGISISPPNATAGTPYLGTITYSGGHAGSVNSMAYSNSPTAYACMGSPIPIGDGLSIVYNGLNTATVSGTPTSATNLPIFLKMFDGAGCPASGANTDRRGCNLIVGGTVSAAPSFPVGIPNVCAQLGSDVQLAGSAAGIPTPQYQWWNGVTLTPIPGANSSILSIPNVQLTNSGAYVLTASNSSTVGGTIFTLPKVTCYLSVCITGGTNFTTLNYTNHVPAGQPLTIYSYVTNVATASDYYSWVYNGITTVSTSNTVQIAANSLTPAKSGTYSVTLVSTNAGAPIIPDQQNYYSYWAFGYMPVFTNSLPVSTNVNIGASVSLSIALGGTLNVYNAAGGTSSYTTNANPCVFWYKDGNNLVAAQIYTNNPTSNVLYSNTFVNASLALNNLSLTDTGNYTVVATNWWGSITSSPVALTLGSSSFAPVIATNPPANISLLAGQSTTIRVAVTGTPPLSYQWQLGGGNLSDGGVYSGTATTNLMLTGVTANNSGNYALAITNTAGAITSSVTAVTIALPPSIKISVGSPGTLQFNSTTVTGLTYVVELNTNLASSSWTPIQTNNTGLAGTINYQTNISSGLNQFFRLIFP